MAGLQFGLGFAKTIFWGLDFCKTETNLFLDFVRAEEGSGEESTRALGAGARVSNLMNTFMIHKHLAIVFVLHKNYAIIQIWLGTLNQKL